MNRTVSLIANHMEVEVDLPCAITNEVTLRKPSDDELTDIRDILIKTSVEQMSYWMPYEAVFSSNEQNGSLARQTKDPALWKYWVLSSNDGFSTHVLERASRLLSPSLEMAFTLRYSTFNGNENMGYSQQLHIAERFRSTALAHKEIIIFNESTLNNLKEINVLLNAIQAKYLFISTALAIFDDVSRIPNRSNLKIIGYFSVIEALITHAPRLTESLDSISHQIRGKIKLLSHRFDEPLNTSELFGNIKSEKLWSKLYAFRSKVAHGDVPKFNGELSVLKNKDTVMEFIEIVCKQLLIQSLKEPELFQDLRAC
jgi:hypothetical protein